MVVATLLEAVKTVTEKVSTYRMELADRGVDDSRRLVSVYGDARRLKDYLQRCLVAFRDQVDLDIADEDQPLLSACCRHGAELADARLAGCTDQRERQMVQQKRDHLIEWAVDLASDPLMELPLPKSTGGMSPAMRGLRMRITQKFSGAVGAMGGLSSLGPSAGVADDDDDGWGPVSTGSGARPMPSAARGMPPAARGMPASMGVRGGGQGVSPAQPATSWTNSEASGRASPRSAQPTPAQPTAAPANDSPPIAALALPIESTKIRDPRLRSMLALDLRAYDRAVAGSDYRMGAVHLTSVLEGAVLDHAIPRTLELGLAGPPESWNPQEVLLRVFGDNCTPQERAAAHHAFTARTLIRPAMQLKSPLIVTAVSFRKHRDFVVHALRMMGYV